MSEGKMKESGERRQTETEVRVKKMWSKIIRRKKPSEKKNITCRFFYGMNIQRGRKMEKDKERGKSKRSREIEKWAKQNEPGREKDK